MAEVETKHRLTKKQYLFIEAYCGEARFNATKAAIIAGHSPKTATVIASENLRKPYIKDIIDKKIAELVMPASQVLTELSDIATAEWRDFLEVKKDAKGEVIDATLKLGDKIKALELIGKHYKLFTDKTELSNPEGESFRTEISGKMDLAINKIYGDNSGASENGSSG